MADNLVVETDHAENYRPSKKKSTDRIDGIVAALMGLDRALRGAEPRSVAAVTSRPPALAVVGRVPDVVGHDCIPSASVR